MTANIVHFVPRAGLLARDNLREFIRVCREDITVFGADLDWSSDYWPAARVSFGNLDQKSRAFDPTNAMRAPFVDFAKAYFRYHQGHRPNKSRIEMRALKCLERALSEEGEIVDVLNCTNKSLDRAAELATQFFSSGVAYRIGGKLAGLARFVSANKLVGRHLVWMNPIIRPGDSVRTGIKAKKARFKKLPNEKAVHALADIFASKPVSPKDIFTSSVAAILLCAPSRVSEVLALEVDCEVWEKKRDGSYSYGLRFQPGKGAPAQIKWVPDSMQSLAQEAISRVRELTEEPRAIAGFYEKNPKQMYRHANRLLRNPV